MFKKNPQNSSTIIRENIACGYSMSTICTFDDIENKHDIYRGKGCMKKFCEYLKQHAMEVINY